MTAASATDPGRASDTALRLSEQRFRALVEHNSDAIVVTAAAAWRPMQRIDRPGDGGDALRMDRAPALRTRRPDVSRNGGGAHYEGPIDLLLTDVVMPAMSGADLAKELLRIRPGLRVLYASGYAESVIVSHGVVDPHVDLVQKPFTPERLLRKIRELLDRR